MPIGWNARPAIAIAVATSVLVACGPSARTTATVADTTSVLAATSPSRARSVPETRSPAAVGPTTAAPTSTVSTAATSGPVDTTTGPTRPATLAAARAPWMVATRADGVVELWSAGGRAGSWSPCAGPELHCAATIEAISDGAVWIVRWKGDGTASLLRSPLRGGVLSPVDLGPLAPGGSFAGVAASVDGGTLWFGYTEPGRSWGNTLYRLAGGRVTAVSEPGVIDVVLSPDGQRLAYSRYRDTGTGGYPDRSAIVIVDLATGATRSLDHRAGDPFAAMGLAWSADNRHLLFQFGFEGSVPKVVDVDTTASLDDAVVPAPAPATPGAYAMTPACWSSPGTVALGLWSWGVESPGVAGALVDSDVAKAAFTTRLPSMLGGQAEIACRADGAIATVRYPMVDGRGVEPGDPDARRVGDLVVVRRDGTTTVLGHGYVAVEGV